MQSDILNHMDGLVRNSKQAGELVRAYADWATQSLIHLAISCLAMIFSLLCILLFIRNVLVPGFRVLTFKKARDRISRRKHFVECIRPERLNALTAPSLLQEAVDLWGEKPRTVDDEGGNGGKDLDGNEVEYPMVFYRVRPPKGTTGSVKTLFKVIAQHEPGWVMRPSRKGGATEFFNSQIGYRI